MLNNVDNETQIDQDKEVKFHNLQGTKQIYNLQRQNNLEFSNKLMANVCLNLDLNYDIFLEFL